MDIDKATRRILTAIENPFTHILGHPTGRLLLAREGYPLDFDQIIQACADNDVVIELNASPHRLDIDWTLIQQALDAGVQIAINPDAHSISGIKDIKYGVLAAQKGGLTKSMCLNTLSQSEFDKWVVSLKY
jgi:DNA polymerase (family 10)